MEVLEVVDTDRDEDEVGVAQGIGGHETHRLACGGAGPCAGLPVDRRAVAVGESGGELAGDGRPVVLDGVARRDTVPERDDLHPAIARADSPRDAVSVSESWERAGETVA